MTQTEKKSFLDTVESLAKIVGVGAACFGVFTYFDALEQEKINRSLAYYDEFHSGQIFQARIDLEGLARGWLDSRKTDGSSLTLPELQALMLRDLAAVPNVINYDLINEFFLRAKNCIDVGGCDRDTLVKLMQPEAEALYVLMAPRVIDSGEVNSEGLLCFLNGFRISECQVEA